MKRSDLVERISSKLTFFTKQDVEEGTILILDLISESLYNRDRVEIRGFGIFSSRKRTFRMARNPSTGKAITVGTKFHPFFRSSKALKEELNK